MKLHFNNKHLSISQFNPIELSNFTVLTGVNGSGKSHLLEAIELKYVTIEGIDNPNIVRFNYETFKLENEGAYNAQAIAVEREAAWNYFEHHIKPSINSWRVNIGDEYKTLTTKCEADNKSFWSVGNSEALKGYKQNVRNFFSQPNIKGNLQAVGISSLARKLRYSIDEINRDDFIDLIQAI